MVCDKRFLTEMLYIFSSLVAFGFQIVSFFPVEIKLMLSYLSSFFILLISFQFDYLILEPLHLNRKGLFLVGTQIDICCSRVLKPSNFSHFFIV